MGQVGIGLSKSVGGLEAKEVKLFNMALLHIWFWRRVSSERLLWVSIVKCRYGSFMRELSGVSELKNGLSDLGICMIFGGEGWGVYFKIMLSLC